MNKKNFLELFKTLMGVSTFMVTAAVATKDIVNYGEIWGYVYFREIVIGGLIVFFLLSLIFYIIFQMIAD